MAGHVIRIGLGLFFCYLTYDFFTDDIFLFALIPLILAFACFYTYLGDLLAAPFGNIFFSAGGGPAAPKQFSKVQGLLAQRQYEQAIQELELMTARNPDLVSGKVLLINTLYENLNRPDDALEIASAELEADKWCEDHGKIVMTTVDILLEKGEKQMAIAVLERAVQKLKKYALTDGLRMRLASLESRP